MQLLAILSEIQITDCDYIHRFIPVFFGGINELSSG
jgi:hypothetical protein